MSVNLETIHVSYADAIQQVEQTLEHCGASQAHAVATGRSIVAAEAEGNKAVGFLHLMDYCDALTEGRADGQAIPEIEKTTETLVRINANSGFPHWGVDQAWDGFVAAAHRYGVAILASRNGYTCGALGFFLRRLAQDHNLAGFATTNAGPAVMPASGGKTPLFCTNPLAFAIPCEDKQSILIDQSSTAGALVSIHQAAATGASIPEGWALTAKGEPTTDPQAALAGLLLPFGGARGANIALMVELFTAGITGGNWSSQAPSFKSGNQCPDVGLFIIAISPAKTTESDFQQRIERFVQEIQSDGAYVPGFNTSKSMLQAQSEGLEIDRKVWEKICLY